MTMNGQNATPLTPMTDLTGQQLGSYRILHPIGKGGTATVYTAQHVESERIAATKVLRLDMLEDTRVIQRFEREAQLIGQASHPHIVALYESGQQDELLYLTMQLLSGGSLSQLIRRTAEPLPVSEVERLFGHIADALAYAHQLNIVHRDLKPQNVLLDEQHNAYLADFGIAKLIHQTSTQGITGTGILGTPAYMAPEQWQDEPVDERTDIYAMGVLLFEMLVGKPPFEGDNPLAIMNKHLYEPPPSLVFLRSDAPAGIAPVLDRALAKAPEQRFASVPELAEAVKRGLSGRRAARVAVPKVRLGQSVAERDAEPSTHILTPEQLASADSSAAGDGTRRLSPAELDSPTSVSAAYWLLTALRAFIYGAGWLILVFVTVGIAALAQRHALTFGTPFDLSVAIFGMAAVLLTILVPIRVVSRSGRIGQRSWHGRLVGILSFFVPSILLMIGWILLQSASRR